MCYFKAWDKLTFVKILLSVLSPILLVILILVRVCKDCICGCGKLEHLSSTIVVPALVQQLDIFVVVELHVFMHTLHSFVSSFLYGLLEFIVHLLLLLLSD